MKQKRIKKLLRPASESVRFKKPSAWRMKRLAQKPVDKRRGFDKVRAFKLESEMPS